MSNSVVYIILRNLNLLLIALKQFIAIILVMSGFLSEFLLSSVVSKYSLNRNCFGDLYFGVQGSSYRLTPHPQQPSHERPWLHPPPPPPSPQSPLPAHRSGRKGPVQQKTPFHRCPLPHCCTHSPSPPRGATSFAALTSSTSIKLKLAALNCG